MVTGERSRVAVVCSVAQELSALQSLLHEPCVGHHGGREFHCGHLDGHHLVLALSGSGKVAAAMTAVLLVERFNADRMVFTGVAGGLAMGVNVGDLVVARTLLQHDMDASPHFPRYEVPRTGRSYFPADAQMSDQLSAAARRGVENFADWLGQSPTLRALSIVAPKVHEGLVISGDRDVSSPAEQALLRHNLPAALAVDMEGAALAQVCGDLDVPFAMLRTVADSQHGYDHPDTSHFLKEVASRYAATVVRAWLRA